MQPVGNVEDIRTVEQRLVDEGVSVSELMHRAGSAVAQEVLRLGSVKTVCVLVGFGNNGGDGWVAAEELLKAGVSVTVVSPVEASHFKGDLVSVVSRAAIKAGVSCVVGPPREELAQLLVGCDVVIDAIFGIGFHGRVRAPFDIWIDAVNTSGSRVVSIDVPSGLSAQTGHAEGPCVAADLTVTMLALKPGLLADMGRDVSGGIVVAPLAAQTDRLIRENDPLAWRCEIDDYNAVIKPPVCSVDKFTRGRVLVVGGSRSYPGAAIMAAKAAARSGAGYVILAVPSCIADICRSHLIEIPVIPMPSDEQSGMFSADARSSLAASIERTDVVLAGPGMGVSASTVAIITALLETPKPLVLDADALNCLARLTVQSLDTFPELLRRPAPLVLTPHRQELGRLVGMVKEPPDSLVAALEAARRIVWSDGGSDFAIVAKGTATACLDVNRALLIKPGPATLATAGSGDVLAGIIAATFARAHGDVVDVALLCALACEIHGLAGRIAGDRRGSRGAIAPDIIDACGLALDAFEDRVLMSASHDGSTDLSRADHASDDRGEPMDTQPRRKFAEGGCVVVNADTVPKRNPLDRWAWVEIDLAALRKNVRTFRSRMQARTRLMCVVKADAYGHGASHCASAMSSAGADEFGVATVAEGVSLRTSGITQPILILSEPPIECVKTLVEYRLMPTVYTPEFALAFGESAAAEGCEGRYHLAIDTGMTRIGVMPEDVVELRRSIDFHRGLVCAGVFTHFATAELLRDWDFELQLKRFCDAVSALREAGLEYGLVHCDNTAATVLHPDTHFDMCRVGIGLYGLHAAPELSKEIDLVPVMSVFGRITRVVHPPVGTGVSYGMMYRVPRPCVQIATVPIGYADGLCRELSSKMEVIVQGERLRQEGTICMDQFMFAVDVNPARTFQACRPVEVGDVVTIMGRDGNECITADDLAAILGTINYEVVCNFGRRLEKVYV